jgi:tetratricopeptide (TPR) repeat protein
MRREIIEAFQRMKEKDYAAAELILNEGLKKAEAEKDPNQEVLFYSTLGVLSKVRGESQEAWRYYEKAEKLLPDDPSLKIIVAKLLIDQFAQYDTAIKKLKKVLKLAKGSASFEHQAHATMAIAYLKKGEKKKAIELLDRAMDEDFQRVASAENLNFEVIETFLARNLEVDRCRRYVDRALQLAKLRKEEKPVRFLTKLLESFEVTLVGSV